MALPPYLARQQAFTQQAQIYQKAQRRLSWLRLGSFMATMVLVVILGPQPWWVGLGLAAIFLGFFLFLVKKFQALEQAESHAHRMAMVNAQEHQASQHNWSAFAAGETFASAQHPYAIDLDLFQPQGVFPFLNRTTTVGGQARLAAFLLAPAQPAEIVYRQEWAKTLAPALDWRQHFRAFGLESPATAQELAALQAWVEQPTPFYDPSWHRWALVALPIWNLLACSGGILLSLPFWGVALLLGPSLWWLRQQHRYVSVQVEQTARAETWLKTYAQLFAHLEQAPWGLIRPFEQRDRPLAGASPSIRQLSYLLSQLQVRNNIFAVVLNVVGLWDLQWLYRLEAWKKKHRPDLPEWLAALAEADALCSLANVAYNHPAWAWPVVHAPAPNARLEAQALGHPLLDPARRIDNHLSMPTSQHFKLLTGSNMAGKSTWLRTLGVNLVLAQAGTPVCAQALSMPGLQVFTCMRTSDNLAESSSSFWAELKRLRALLDAIAEPPNHLPVFALLDEVLKGTNSRDRHRGAQALLQQLLEKKVAGFLATHDLELTQLAVTRPHELENLRMEVSIQQGTLHFDYLLKPGATQSFNATFLMQQMGIGNFD